MRQNNKLVALSVVFLSIGSAGQAYAGCAGSWDYSIERLQEARRRIKSPAHTNRVSQVECGQDILTGLETAVWPSTKCKPCIKEYIQYLRDLILFSRAAAERVPAANRPDYYNIEIDLRKILGNFLVKNKDQYLVDFYLTENSEGMRDAVERSNQRDGTIESRKGASLASPANQVKQGSE